MGKNIVIIGSTNTKGHQLGFLKEKIESRGHRGILMDISMGGQPAFEPDIAPEEIARLAGEDISNLIASKDRLFITNIMTAGAQQKALQLLSQGELDGIVSLGGSTIALVGSGHGKAAFWNSESYRRPGGSNRLRRQMVRRH